MADSVTQRTRSERSTSQRPSANHSLRVDQAKVAGSMYFFAQQRLTATLKLCILIHIMVPDRENGLRSFVIMCLIA